MLGKRLRDAYSVLFYIVFFAAGAGSISYALRLVRGSYLYFTLGDAQAPGFFMGSLLVSAAGLIWLLYQLGPLAFSPAELFWRYSGLRLPSRNPWSNLATQVVLGLWALLSILLATIFAPLSPFWLVGTALGAILFGAIMLQGMAAVQLMGCSWLLLSWALMALVTGIILVVVATAAPLGAATVALAYPVAGGVLVLGVAGATVSTVMARGRLLEWATATQGYGRSTLLLYAVRNLSGAQGYRYYGAQRRRFRARISNARPLALSLAALADSLAPLVLITLLSVPLGIFIGVGYGAPGIGIVTVLGVWLVAFFYRWLPREWSAHVSLRQWLSAPYLPVLLGFSAGAGAATVIYALVMACIFQLPPVIAVAALFYGAAVSLGETDPPQEYDYSLVVTLPSGIVLPVEPLIAAGSVMVQIAVVAVSVLTGPVQGLLVPAVFCAWRLIQHYRKGRVSPYP